MRGGPWRRAAVLCGLVVVADQAAKAAIEANLVPGERVELIGPLSLTLAHNTGIAFGLASGAGFALVVLALVALAFVFVVFARDASQPGMWVAIGLLAGGALGNLADRVRAGQVTDYVDFGSWPPFNIADAAITLGVAALILSYVRAERSR